MCAMCSAFLLWVAYAILRHEMFGCQVFGWRTLGLSKYGLLQVGHRFGFPPARLVNGPRPHRLHLYALILIWGIIPPFAKLAAPTGD